MSLINRMLQDLEARHAEPAETNTFPGKVHAVAPRRAWQPQAWLITAVLLCASLGVALWMIMRNPAPNAPAKPIIARSPQMPSAPTVAPPAPLAPKAVAPVQPAPAPTTTVQSSPLGAIAVPESPAKNPAIAQAPAQNPGPMQSAAPSSTETVKEPVRTAPPVQEKKSAARFVPERESLVAEKLKKSAPSQPPAEERVQKALGLIQQGQLDEGRALLEEALQVNPAHLPARQALLGILVETKRYEKAIELLQDGLALHPNQAGFAMALARLQVERADGASALQTLEHYESAGRDNAEYQAFRATLLARNGRHKEAITHYQKALANSPQSGVWWIGLAMSLEADNQTASAREAYRRAQQGVISPDLYAYSEQRLAQLAHQVQ